MAEDNNFQSNKIWATGALFFSLFTGVIGGSILGWVYGKFAVFSMTQECAKQLAAADDCVDEPRILIKSLTLGLITGMVAGTAIGSILYLKFTRQPMIPTMAVSLNGKIKHELEKS